MYAKIDNPEKYKAAFYLRLSKEDFKKGDKQNDDSKSIKNQRDLLENYAKEQGLMNYTIYTDDGYTGTNSDRPDLQRMFEDIRCKKINMVITKDLSRLSRNHIDSGNFLESFFPEHHVRYIALTDNFDTETDGYTCEMAMFKSMFNDLYAKDISKKITSVKRNKQKQGLFIGGKAPYGYKKSEINKGVLEIDPETVDNVRRIFQLAKEGKSCRQIAVIFNEANIPTPAQHAKIKPSKKRGVFSGKWSSERISAMLQDEVYIGSMVQGRVKSLSYKSKKPNKVPKEEWIVVENTHEPIVDKETFEKVGMMIKSRNHTRCCKHDFLLKGLIFCHECGYPLGVSNRDLSGNRKALYFICRTYQRFTNERKCTTHSIRVEYVTEKVIEQVKSVCDKFINDVDFNKLLEQINKDMQEEKIKQGKDLITLKAKLHELTAKIDSAYDDKLSGIISDDMFVRVYEKYTNEIESIQNRISDIKEKEKEEKPIDIEQVKSLAEKFLNANEYSRELLVSLIDRIELTESKEIIINFRFKEFDI